MPISEGARWSYMLPYMVSTKEHHASTEGLMVQVCSIMYQLS